METIVEEVKLWNTPAVGAYLLWKFTQGYSENHPSGDSPIGLLHFVALPILTNRSLLLAISDKRDDLQSYIRSFEQNQTSDLLLNIQERILEKRKYTLQSIDMAIMKGLIVWDAQSGKIFSRTILKQPDRGFRLKPNYERDGKKAYILGKWFSKHDHQIIGTYLKIVF